MANHPASAVRERKVDRRWTPVTKSQDLFPSDPLPPARPYVLKIPQPFKTRATNQKASGQTREPMLDISCLIHSRLPIVAPPYPQVLVALILGSGLIITLPFQTPWDDPNLLGPCLTDDLRQQGSNGQSLARLLTAKRKDLL